MNNIESVFESVREAGFDFVDTGKIEHRYNALLEGMENYIRGSKYEEKLRVNPSVLAEALRDYFVDIGRLKKLHNIPHVNSIKIVAYTSYWLLKRKPIQILEVDRELIYANERYVFSYIMDFLNNNVNPSDDLYFSEKEGLNAFRETLFYFLKYRFHEPSGLEMIITAFFAGQIYQSDEDISDVLSSKYSVREKQ